MKRSGIKIHYNDNVVTATDDIYADEIVICNDGNLNIIAMESIPIYHKIASKPIKKGERIIKYGEVIGIALNNISVGSWVHIHNLRSMSLYKEVES